MKIGIDARFYGKAGPGRYTKNIIQHLEKVDKENDYIIFMGEEGFETYTPKNENFKKVLADYAWYSFAEQTTYLASVLRQKLDLYYVPHFNIPVLYPKKIVTAIPDMTMHTYSTEKGTTLPTWYFRLKKVVYKAVFWWAVFRSYKVIVPSKTVLNEFVEHIKGISSDKYVLAYEGVDPDYLKKPKDSQKVLEKYGVNRDYILSVGSMYEHKNVDGLIDMFKILKEGYGYKGQLVLASKRDKFSEGINERVKKEKLEKDILVLAFSYPNPESDIVVSDEEIIALRMHAKAYVMGAFKEGFSLTAMEGMAVGLPAALSDIECHREVYGDSVLFFNPSDPKDIAEKVNTLITNGKVNADYVNRGYELVKTYDWIKAAEITLEVFIEALKKGN
ncbi:glycosyltransferase family 4 protein [Patescibacteria group bacterium]